MTTADDVVFTPAAVTVAGSQLTEFTRFCEERTGRRFDDYAALHAFSVEQLDDFWRLFLEWSALVTEGSTAVACTDPSSCESARFFPDLSLSYVDNLLRAQPAGADRPALVARHADRPPDIVGRRELRERAAATARQLERLGVRSGDHVAAIARNNVDCVVAALGTAALGATFSTVGTDMGADAIVSRLRQLEPTLLFVTATSEADPTAVLGAADLTGVVAALRSLRALVTLDGRAGPGQVPIPVEPLTGEHDSAATLARFGFNHPLFVLFTSGTTGPPKCIVHGAGGTLLEHVKEHRLHVDLRPTDTLFFHTSVAWMMWNWQLSALATGATVVLYDGPVASAETLWRIVADERVTVFGTSPPYLQMCADSGFVPRRSLGLPALRAVLSTGSVLRDAQYDWVRDNVGDLPLQSISGGTDIVGCFVLGNPNLPVRRGLIQCLGLGLDVRAHAYEDATGGSGIGELVCCRPFPSRPLGLVGDSQGARFHDAYFSQHEGVWTHGDLVEIDDAGHVRMHGRSDGVLNINGVRIGPAEIYAVLQDVPEIREAMAVQQETSGRDSARIILLVVLREGALDSPLVGRIRRDLAQHASPAHVPQLVVQVEELPRTFSGKLSDSAVRAVVNGSTVANQDALSNPASLALIAAAVAEADRNVQEQLESVERGGTGTVQDRLLRLWERVLDIAPIDPDDNFFDLGGTSLAAIRLIYGVHVHLGVDLPPSALLEAPTVASMAALVERDVTGVDVVITLREGERTPPLFVLHGLSGDHLEVHQLLTKIRTDRRVHGVRARAERTPGATAQVEAMAAAYLPHVRAVQPSGPYALLGYSFGGLLAYEMARQLSAAGQDVETLILVDSYVHRSTLSPTRRVWFQLDRLARVARVTFGSPRRQVPWLLRRIAMRWLPWLGLRPVRPLPPHVRSYVEMHRGAYHAYRPGSYDGRVTFIRAEGRLPLTLDPLPIWSRLVGAGLVVDHVPGSHGEILREPLVETLAGRISARLGEA